MIEVGCIYCIQYGNPYPNTHSYSTVIVQMISYIPNLSMCMLIQLNKHAYRGKISCVKLQY